MWSSYVGYSGTVADFASPSGRRGSGRLLGDTRSSMAALLAVAAGLSLAGCASSRQAGVEGVAAGFYQAIAERDGEAACRLLAPATLSELEQSAGKPCAQAVVEEDIPGVSEPVDVTVFDTAARARVGSETAFLGQFRSGWRVVAAGCTPRSPRPYDCVLSGG